MIYEKLKCYRQAVEVAKQLGIEMSGWPRGYGYLADQLRRAMSSVVLNLAEGNARFSHRERRRFFQISRASLAEVSACIDLMEAYLLISCGKSEGLKQRIDCISAMIYRLR